MISKPNTSKHPKRFSMDVGMYHQGFMNLQKEVSWLQGNKTDNANPVLNSKMSFDQVSCLKTNVVETDNQTGIKALFNSISTSENKVTTQILENILLQMGEDPRHAIDMVEFLDPDNKGYVQYGQFALFFCKKTTYAPKKQIPLRLKKKAELVRFISQNSDSLRCLEDERVCEKMMREYKASAHRQADK